ncbi:hypothetical protein EAH79_07455 [Sphingomonas koreensis]|nr:hypothetical protein EAH79_07455 [Sphingomonas koreensis]
MSSRFFGALFNPQELVQNPQLEPEVKRAILASWASDAFAIRSQSTLRKPPKRPSPVPVQDVLAALTRLDGPAPEAA